MSERSPRPEAARRSEATTYRGRSLLDQLASERTLYQGRLIMLCMLAVAVGGLVSAVGVALVIHPNPMIWGPYLLGPVAALGTWALDRSGRRNAAVMVLTLSATVISGQAGLIDPTSVGSALYLLPVAMFVVSFIESTVARRLILGALLAVALLQRLVRLAIGLDASMEAWIESTFHSVAIYVLFAVLIEFLHQRHVADRRRLERAYWDVSQARLAAEAEATAALDGSRNTSTFLEAMSHELRTPLNAVVGYAELLLDDAPDEESQQDLQRICSAGRHMAELVDDVLDVSKVESGRLQRDLSRVDVRATLKAVSDLARPLLRPGVALLVQVEEGVDEVVTDGQKLRQLLLNLLSNAAKFTSRGSIHLRATARDDELVLAVEDTGKGMDPEEADRMFEAYAQADHSQGTGLGLALCVRFAELLGGRIDVTTDLGLGSTFTVHVPLRPRGLDEVSSDTTDDKPRRLRDDPDALASATQWLTIGALASSAYGLATTVLVVAGILPSYLGPWPYLGLLGACVLTLALARGGFRYGGLAVLTIAVVLVDAHSHVFHPHAQAAVLYLCVLAALSSLILPARAMPATLVGGGVAILGMLGLRSTQGLDSTDQLFSIALDATLIYTVTALLLGMWVKRHRSEEDALAEATFDIDRLRAQSTSLARAANAATRAKSSFVAAMSHELRSPLNAILGYAALLDEEWPADAEGRDDIEAIRRAGAGLLELINEVLDLARVQASGLPLAPEPLELAQLATEHGMGIDGRGQVHADRHAMGRLLGLLAQRGATTLRVQGDALMAELPCGDLRGDPLEPLGYDPCLGRPGAGWALAHALCQSIGGQLNMRVTSNSLLVRVRLPDPPT